MIFFLNPRVKFALFFDAIRDNLAQKLEGTKAFKLNIFQEFLGFKGYCFFLNLPLNTSCLIECD